MKTSSLVGRGDLIPAARLFAKACRRSRRWCSYVNLNIRRHGDVRGNHTSGCYNPDWPEQVQHRLRVLSYAVTDASDAAYAARPRGVFRSTMHTLAKAIARRDGHGYYGPTA